jgi:hypothetical protein
MATSAEIIETGVVPLTRFYDFGVRRLPPLSFFL